MVMDSLRYWVEVCHVDGFRFDLATTLARGPNGFDRNAAFLTAIRQDPVLASVKLVAEPWDLGMGGYQVGAFPSQWSEWNDRYRSAMRRYWSGEGSLIGEVSSRMTGSSDLFNHDGRIPRASVNHITVHDGFTLADLFSYNAKHNEANGEDNRDGANDNHSNNCGHEGPTDDPAITALRRQLRKNQLACLLLAQGVPLLLAGDEVGNTQNGNNNAYCQDNETGWVGWAGLNREGCDLTDFIGHLTDIRRRFPQIRARRWLDGRRADGSYGVLWLTPSAEDMKEQDWNFPEGRFLAYVLGPADHGQPPIFIVLNAAPEAITFKLPKLPEYKSWQQLLNTADAKQTVGGFRIGKRGHSASPLDTGLFGFDMNERQFGAQADRERRNISLVGAGGQTRRSPAGQAYPLARGKDGWFAADIAGTKAGTRYKFRIDDEIDVPDPASAFQPDDVFGPSEVIDHASYRWRTGDWRGRPWHETVLIETHVGTFTREGTYRAMIDKLDHLAAAGITALELLPLADFAGTRNWGYDGVLWYAPDSAYGRPEDLKRLIDAAHQRGLMVFLDVVYNHFGPEGNFLGRYAPDFFTRG